MVADPERRSCGARVLRARPDAQAALGERVLDAQPQRERVAGLRVERVRQHDPRPLDLDGAPARPADEPVDRAAGRHVVDRQLELLALPFVAAAGEPVRPRREHLAAARRAHLVLAVAEQDAVPLADPAADLDHDDALRRRRRARTARPTGGSRRADCEAVDDVAQDGRVRVDLGEPRPRPLRRLVGVAARALGAVLAHVAVGVEDVVHDLEQEPELLARTRATASAPPPAARPPRAPSSPRRRRAAPS